MIVDHENMYEKGILHRDISFGNILICDDDTNDMKDAGMLIDLDHAKYSSNRRPLPFYQGQTMDQFFCRGIVNNTQVNWSPT